MHNETIFEKVELNPSSITPYWGLVSIQKLKCVGHFVNSNQKHYKNTNLSDAFCKTKTLTVWKYNFRVRKLGYYFRLLKRIYLVKYLESVVRDKENWQKPIKTKIIYKFYYN